MSAVISECGKYRYSLTRKTSCPLRWVRKCVFIMLNPSTADATKDDPTIRRCISFAEKLSCPELEVVNLYAYRATDPRELRGLQYEDACGPENYKYIGEALKHAHYVIAAWGKQGGCGTVPLNKMLSGGRVYCLGTNKDGSPKHPLYVPGTAELIDYPTKDTP